MFTLFMLAALAQGKELYCNKGNQPTSFLMNADDGSVAIKVQAVRLFNDLDPRIATVEVGFRNASCSEQKHGHAFDGFYWTCREARNAPFFRDTNGNELVLNKPLFNVRMETTLFGSFLYKVYRYTLHFERDGRTFRHQDEFAVHPEQVTQCRLQ